MAGDSAPLTAHEAQATVRFCWFAFCGILIVLYLICGPLLGGADPSVYPWMSIPSIAVLVAFTAPGYFIRMQEYKRGWVGDAVTPEKYISGNISLLGLLLMAGAIGSFGTWIEGMNPLNAGMVFATLAVMGVNFPNGAAMTPTAMRFATP